MQPQGMSRKKALLLIGVVLVLFIGIVALIATITQQDENQFGKFIRIQNYSAKVKNLSNDMRDSMESSLYNTVIGNVDASTNVSKINDATIREGSDAQERDSKNATYSGSFIIDMSSIKQSYYVQYSYAPDPTTSIGGSPVIISCLPVEKLIYGEFTCTDLASKQSTEDDMILQYLPYENFTFKITPDATQGDKLVLVVDLDISEVDLKGDAASKAQTVTMYKNEVTDWIASKGVDPTKYEIQYNYDDAGNVIRAEEVRS